MKKQIKQQKKEDQIIWRNETHDSKFNPWKKYYSVIKVGEKSFICEYESKFRSEAKAIFDEEARMIGGKVETMGVFK